MALIQIEIESDGQHCGRCYHLYVDGCGLWPLAMQRLNNGAFDRCDECLRAEVTVQGLSGVLGGK